VCTYCTHDLVVNNLGPTRSFTGFQLA
jgi:hypothetical protein